LSRINKKEEDSFRKRKKERAESCPVPVGKEERLPHKTKEKKRRLPPKEKRRRNIPFMQEELELRKKP